jgi:Flp pilus assembly pilin Flp
MASFLAKLWWDRRGQEVTEYAMIGGLVACVAVAILPDMFAIVEHVGEVVGAVLKTVVEIATLK